MILVADVVDQPSGVVVSATDAPAEPDIWSPGRWDRLVAGEESVFAQLYDEYAPLVLQVAYRITGDRAAAEDVVQEVFVHVWRRAVDFDASRGSVRTWLSMIARRRAVDRVRSDTAWRRRTEAEARDVEDRGPDRPVVDPAEQAVAADLAATVRRVLAALPVEQQLAIRLAYFEGHSYRHIATLLGIPEGTAKSRMRLALARLAGALAREGVA